MMEKFNIVDTITIAVLVAFLILGFSWLLSIVVSGVITNFLGMV